MLEIKDVKDKVDAILRRGKIFDYYFLLQEKFPIQINLKSPTSSTLKNDYEKVRNWAKKWVLQQEFKVEYKEIHSIFGKQTIPSYVKIDNFDELITLLKLNKKKIYSFINFVEVDLKQYSSNERILDNLKNYVFKNSFRIFENFETYKKALVCAKYITDHNLKDIYLRQISINNVDTKFIERNLKIVSDLLDIYLNNTLLSDDSLNSKEDNLAINKKDLIASSSSSLNSFLSKYHFKQKPLMIRLRTLDDNVKVGSLRHLTESIAVNELTFKDLNIACQNIFIIENEISFLSFPKIKDSIAIFGSGYGFSSLKNSWIEKNNNKIFYFGDIDTHGFNILNQLRQTLPCTHIDSFLMNIETIEKYQHWKSTEITPIITKSHLLDYLTNEENLAYKALCENKFGPNFRLEQEFIPYDAIKNALQLLKVVLL